MRLFFLIALCAISFSAQAKILVFAPASTTDVMARLADAFKAKTGIEVVASYAGTGQLARQIDAGAPADVVLVADPVWFDWMAKRDLIDAGTVSDLAGNTLVVAVRRETENWASVEGILIGSRFAMGEPDTVPAGRFARQALKKRGLWEKARSRAVFGENVRLALKRLERGEVEAAIVYGSDLRVSPDVRAGLTFRATEHDPILYQGAVVKGSRLAQEAAQFLAFLGSERGQVYFRQAGFQPAPQR